jgi:hypothetical protein
MDRFTKYALITMIAAVAVIIVSTYVGVFVFGGSMETMYITVIEDQAKKLGLLFGHVIELGEEGEYIGFFIAGAVSGLIIGYLIPSVFGQSSRQVRREA